MAHPSRFGALPVAASAVNASKKLAPAFEFRIPKTIQSYTSHKRHSSARDGSSASFPTGSALQPVNRNLPVAVKESHQKQQYNLLQIKQGRRVAPSNAKRPSPRHLNIALTTKVSSAAPGRIAKPTPLPIVEFRRKRQLAPSPAFHSTSTSSPLSQPPATSLSSDHERELLQTCTNSAQALGRYIMNKRALKLSSSPPKVSLTPTHAKPLLISITACFQLLTKRIG